MKFSSGMLPGSNTQRVMIQCPRTGEPVPTGISMDAEAFGNVTLKYQLNCPRCGEPHLWTRKEAFLENASAS